MVLRCIFFVFCYERWNVFKNNYVLVKYRNEIFLRYGLVKRVLYDRNFLKIFFILSLSVI